MSKMVFSCTLCSFCCNERLSLIKHSFEAHSMEPLFSFQCGIRGCSHYFKCGSTFSSFKTHASRKHPNWQEFVNTDTVVAVPSANTPGPSSSADTEELADNSELDLPLVSPIPHEQSELDQDIEGTCSAQSCSESQRRAALFLLTFKEKYRLSQAAIDFAVASIQTIVDSVFASVVAAVERDASPVPAIARNIEDPFASLQTNYQQTVFYRQEFGLVVCACVCICMHLFTC